MDEQTAKRDLIRVCHLMYERSYVVSSDGNVSVRLDDGRILATPTMTCKGRMTEDLIAITDLDGKALNDRRASSELAMHLLIYRERPDVKAVCHAHPPHGTAFAVAGLAIDQPILSEVILTLGCVPLAAYGTPSTDELTRGDAAARETSQRAVDGESWRGRLRRGSLAGVGSSGDAGTHGEDRDPLARARRFEESSGRCD